MLSRRTAIFGALAASANLRAIAEAELGKLHVSASQTGSVQQEEFGKNSPTPSCRT